MAREEKKYHIYDSYLFSIDEDEAREWLIECGDEDPSQQDVWVYMRDCLDLEWADEVEPHLKDCFATGKFLLVGSAGRWNGTFAGGKVLDGFDEVEQAWAHRDYMDIEMYDLCKGGHYEFHVLGKHHDGTDHWTIKELTDKGIQYYENWNYNYGDKRTEEQVHQILWNNSHYSHNVEFTRKYYR
jgi:hypothetical protein